MVTRLPYKCSSFHVGSGTHRPETKIPIADRKSTWARLRARIWAIRYNKSRVFKVDSIAMHDRRFNPAQVHKLENPDRLTFMPPEEVVAALKLRVGSMIADIGAGTGYFAIPVAKAIGPRGLVYAVDVEPSMLRMLDEKLGAPDAPDNIRLVQGDAANTTLPDGKCDLALIANVWHEVEDHVPVLREMSRILKPGGCLAILDWRTDVPARSCTASSEDDQPGPPREYRIPEAQVSDTLRAQNWAGVDAVHIGLYSYLVTGIK